jgi:ribonuclease HI
VKTLWFDSYLQPNDIEALSLLEALRWLTQIGVHNVDFEHEFEQVIDAINSGFCLANKFGTIISKCKDLFLSFQNCTQLY